MPWPQLETYFLTKKTQRTLSSQKTLKQSTFLLKYWIDINGFPVLGLTVHLSKKLKKNMYAFSFCQHIQVDGIFGTSIMYTNIQNKIDWNSEMLLWGKSYIVQTSFPFTMMCSQTLKACCYAGASLARVLWVLFNARNFENRLFSTRKFPTIQCVLQKKNMWDMEKFYPQ